MMEDDENRLNYIKLLTHINQYHPTRAPEDGEVPDDAAANEPKEVRFGICENLGYLPVCKCCKRETELLS